MHALATVTRSWPMLAALGGGLVLAALAAGAGGAPQVVLAGLGVAALGWAVLSLRAGRTLAPRTVLAVCVAALVAEGVAVGAGAMADVAGLPLAAASAFIATTALSVALRLRSGRAARSAPAASRPTRAARTEPRLALVGLVAGALLVSALATPALAATEAGRYAVPHGEHVGAIENDGAHHH